MKFRNKTHDESFGSHKIVSKSNSNRVLLVPSYILEQTQKTFRYYWKKNQEAVAYWCGKENDQDKTDVVLSIVIPKAFHSGGNYEVPADESTKIGKTLSARELVCLAQIHTHPGDSGNHSWYDDENSISKRNDFLSLVMPHFGNIGIYDIQDITVHECWETKWVILDNQAKSKRIVIIDDFVDFRVEDLEYRQ
ncbi:MAG: hypothetical protein LV477_02045 [Candidatus Nitrosotalea sp.]|nr:hypothetical protein [Candidatus Nitrosotalea sp.]